MLSHRPTPLDLGAAVAAVIAAPVVALLIIIRPQFAIAAGAVVVTAALATRISHWPASSAYLLAVLLASALVSVPQSVHVGGYSGGAFLTIALVWLGLPLIANAPWAISQLPVSISLFLLWAVIATHSLSTTAIQNLAVLGVFATGMVVAIIAVRTYDPTGAYLARSLNIASWFGLALFAALYALGMLGTSQAAIEAGRSPRAYALVALLPLAWGLAGLRTRQATPWLALTALLLIGTSLSRGAFAAALILVVLNWLDPQSFHGWIKTLLVTTLVAGAAVVAVTHSHALHDRVYNGGTTYTIQGVKINVEGRNRFWSATWADWKTSPYIGHGAGRADQTVTTTTDGSVTHTHNDYLRILDDYGTIGLALWTLAFLVLLRTAWRARRLATSQVDQRIAWTTFLFTSAVGLTMIVDNPFSYSMIMGPLGVLAGAVLLIDRSSSPVAAA